MLRDRRLLALARRGAIQQHRDNHSTGMDDPEPWTMIPFETCPHPDCRLVREAEADLNEPTQTELALAEGKG